jgi:hypothetical protein
MLAVMKPRTPCTIASTMGRKELHTPGVVASFAVQIQNREYPGYGSS